MELTQNVTYNVSGYVLGKIRAFFNAITESRQRSVNVEVARILHRVEYRNYDFETVLEAVNQGELHDLP